MAAKKVPPFGVKRTSERIPIKGTVHGDIMVFEPLLVREVSIKGASIETSFPMHINSLHDVRLTLGDISVILKGRVAHSHVSEVKQDLVTYRTGIEFVEPSITVWVSGAGPEAPFSARLNPAGLVCRVTSTVRGSSSTSLLELSPCASVAVRRRISFDGYS